MKLRSFTPLRFIQNLVCDRDRLRSLNHFKHFFRIKYSNDESRNISQPFDAYNLAKYFLMFI